MALFVFLTTSARAKVISANFRIYRYRSVGFRLLSLTHMVFCIIVFFICGIGLTSGIYISTVVIKLIKVCILLRNLLHIRWRCLLYWNIGSQQERNDISVGLHQHLLKQFECFKFVNQQWIFLLIRSHLHRGTKVVHSSQMIFP